MIGSEAEARAYCARHLPPERMQMLEQLVELLRAENDRQNLVARASLQETWRRHIADSLQLIDHVPRETSDWLDFGSGGGFPGLVIAIGCPDRAITLIDSRRLRAEWLNRAATELALPNATVLCARAEAVPPRPAGVISARAFAPLGKLLRLCTPFSTPQTIWVLPKGRSAGHELQEQPAIIQRMFHVEHSLTEAHAGILVGQGVPRLS